MKQAFTATLSFITDTVRDASLHAHPSPTTTCTQPNSAPAPCPTHLRSRPAVSCPAPCLGPSLHPAVAASQWGRTTPAAQGWHCVAGPCLPPC